MARQSDIADDLTLAEAVAWLTTLQDSAQRTPAAENAFRAWLEEDPAHARAFSRATDVWDVLPGALAPAALAPPPAPAPRMGYALAASLALLLTGGATFAWLARDPVYETGVGQQQALALDDGTRVALNTDSRMSVDYGPAERRIRLDRGEVLFDVAHNAARPFIVEAGEERIRAIGTSFVVRRDGDHVAVTLLKGRVAVTRIRDHGTRAQPAAMLSPGERLTATPADAPPTASDPAPQIALAIDRPRIEAVTAWRQGNVMLDDTPLGQAAQEINRYGGTPVILADPRLGALRVSGVFAVQDPVQFARLVAELHSLEINRTPQAIELRRP